MFEQLNLPSAHEKETELTEVASKKEILTTDDVTFTDNHKTEVNDEKGENEKSETKQGDLKAAKCVSFASPSSSPALLTSSLASSSSMIDVKQAPTRQAEEFVEEKSKVEVRAAIGGTVPVPPKEDPYYDDSFGCGMSGGGIRSAAFCSGVLWALMNQSMLPPPKNTDNSIQLPRGRIPKFFSCVSGGGYIGASFLWWTRCNGGGDPRTWQSEYFGRMKRGIGYYIDFMHPRRALLDIFQLFSFVGFLFWSGAISFLPITYTLCEMILLPYSCYFNILANNQVEKKERFDLDQTHVDTAFSVALGTDIAWLLFIVLCSGIPVLKIGHLILREISLSELQSVFLTDITTKKLRIFKMAREMVSNLYWYLTNVFVTFAFVVLCDFSPILNGAGSDSEEDVYSSAVADALRIVILSIVFYRSPDLVSNFIQAQIVIWAYRPPHNFFGYVDKENFDAHYRVFAIICKVLLPFTAVVALFRERAVFEFARYRISKAFFDAPGAESALTLKGVFCGAKFGENSPRKLFWTPDKEGHYPVYISGTTVNKWMIIPEASELFPATSLQRELESRFYFQNMPRNMQPYIERILNNGEDHVAKDQKANEMVAAATATESDPLAPAFFKQRTARERGEILNFLEQSVKAHSFEALETLKLIEKDMDSSFQFTKTEVGELLSWLSGPQPTPIRRLSLPQTDAAKRFIGKTNIEYIDSAIRLARESMMNMTVLRPLAVEFEASKQQVIINLRKSLRDLAWRSISPESATFDVLALTSEGWWERYEAGLNEPIFILPPSVSKTEENVHNKLDALIGANPDISLSEAMGMSAAVGSFAREIKKHVRSMSKSQVIFGLHMGRWVNTTSLHWTVQCAIMVVVELLLCLPVIIQGGLDDPFLRTEMNEATGANNNYYVPYWGGTATLLLYAFWAFLLPLMKSSKYYPFLPHSRIASTLSEEDVWDHGIPSMLYLSNGGHTENLGLLPLLARRLRWIVLACGSDEECLALHSALDQARVKLGVSFRELKSDQRRRHVKRVASKELDLKSDIEFFARDELQRILVFEVLYPRAIRSWKKSAGSFAPSSLDQSPQQKGYIFFMQPVDQHPKGFSEGEEPGPTDTPLGAECIEHLDQRHAPLAGCCCRCCHRLDMLRGIGGEFPYHATAFQFFTPTLFDAYHVQGARAMKDAFEIVLDHQVEKTRKKA